MITQLYTENQKKSKCSFAQSLIIYKVFATNDIHNIFGQILHCIYSVKALNMMSPLSRQRLSVS